MDWNLVQPIVYAHRYVKIPVQNISTREQPYKIQPIIYLQDPVYNPLPEERPGGFQWGQNQENENAGQGQEDDAAHHKDVLRLHPFCISLYFDAEPKETFNIILILFYLTSAVLLCKFFVNYGYNLSCLRHKFS